MNAAIELLDVLAWPVTTIVLALFFKSPLLQLVSQIQKIKYKGLEIQISTEVSNFVGKIESEYLPLKPKMPESHEEQPRMMYSRVPPMYEDYLDDSWFLLQRGIFDLAARANLDSRDDASPLGVAEALYKMEILNTEDLKTYRDLISMRNKLSHAREIIDEDTAREFHRGVKIFEGHLNSIRVPRSSS